MKKISLKSIRTEEFLSREELRQIIGGVSGSTADAVCTASANCGNGVKLTCQGYIGNGCAGVDGDRGYVACQDKEGVMRTTKCNS